MADGNNNDNIASNQQLPLSKITRRNLMIAAGVGVTNISGFSKTATAQSQRLFAVEQGDSCDTISPFSRNESIESEYNYEARPVSSDSKLQKENTARLFLYDGPNGLSLVTILDSTTTNSGGAVTYDISGLPEQGNWIVQDDPGDDYGDSVNWAWADYRTDGGAFRGGLDQQFEITINPKFNGQANKNPIDSGEIESWEFIHGDYTNPSVIPLQFEEGKTELTIRSGACANGGRGSNGVTASINPTEGVIAINENVTLDASASSGNIADYTWELGDGATETGQSVTHKYESTGRYIVNLTISTEDGTTDTTTTEIVVANQDELAFSIQPDSPSVGQSLTFEAIGGENYEWGFGDGTTATGQQVTHTYDTAETYTVTVFDSANSVSRELEIQDTPITVTDIRREYGGVPIESISYEDTFKAIIESDAQLETVEFALGDQSKTATNTGNTWQADFDLGQLDLSDVLTVTATDTEGVTKTSQQSVSIAAIPEWMEWLLDVADISVDEENTRIDIAYDPFNLDSFTFSLGGIPIDVDPPEFDGAPQAEIGYDAGQQAAILDANGGIEAELFGYGFSAALEVEGKIDTELDLAGANGEAEAGISAQVGPPLYVNVPPGVPCLEDRLGVETTVSPGISLDAAFNDEFEFNQGTAIPETVITVGTQLDICGAGAGAEVQGDLQSSFDIGTGDPNLSGTVVGTGAAWVDVSGLQATIDVKFEVTLPASDTQATVIQAQDSEPAEWQVANKRGSQPDIDIDSVDTQTISTSSVSALAPAATTSNSYQRLTDRPLEDTQPTIASGANETMVVWSSHREAASAAAGRDIAYRTETSNGWSEVTYLTTESRSHTSPDAAVSDGAILAAWEYVNTDIDEQTDATDLHPHVEIAYALYDGESWTDPTVLTDTSNREFQPSVAATDEGWVVAWEQSTAASPDSGQRNIRYTQITPDGTAGAMTDIANAIYPDTGQYTGSGAVLGYANLVDGEPAETVAARIVDGATTESQQFDASAVRAVTVGEDRLVWQEGNVSEPIFIEGDRTTGTTTELAVRDEVVATAEPTLAADGDEAVLSYRAYVADGDTRELVYRLNRGSGWIFDRQFVQAPQANQSVWQPQSAFGAGNDAFRTVFAISSTQRDSKNDIFLTEHDFLPEYAISADGPSGATAGETVTLEYDIRNRGDIDGTQSVTVAVSNEAGTQAIKNYSGLAAGKTVSDSTAVTVDETGGFELTVSTDETSQTTAVATSSNFDVKKTTVRVATPQLRVEEITTTGAETVAITVGNTGGATAFGVPLSVTDGEAELINTTISKIPYDDVATAAVTIDPSDIDRSGGDRVVLDPEETLPDAVSDSARITPTWLLQPNLRVTEEINYRKRPVGQTVAEVVVSNVSPVGGAATVEALTPDGSVVGETTITVGGSVNGTRYTTANVSLDASVSEDDTLRFAIDPAVPDADPTTLSQQTTVGPVLEPPESGGDTTVGDIEGVPSKYATDNDNDGELEVTPGNALEALEDYQNDELTPAETLKVLNAYSSSN